MCFDFCNILVAATYKGRRISPNGVQQDVVYIENLPIGAHGYEYLNNNTRNATVIRTHFNKSDSQSIIPYRAIRILMP